MTPESIAICEDAAMRISKLELNEQLDALCCMVKRVLCGLASHEVSDNTVAVDMEELMRLTRIFTTVVADLPQSLRNFRATEMEGN